MTDLVIFTWTDEGHMVPARGHAKRCDEKFTVGELYRMEVSEERSHRSHRHYFAQVHEAWLNLPEEWAERFPSPDHLRRWCLIKEGFCDCHMIYAPDLGMAKATAGVIRKINEFAVIIPDEHSVSIYTAKSQDLKSMGKVQFQESKDAVLGKLAELIGVTTEDLKERAGQA